MALALDGTPVSSTGTGTSVALPGLTTTKTNDVIIVLSLALAGSAITVSSVTDTAGLTYYHRATANNGTSTQFVDAWYAVSSGILTSDVITIHYSIASTYGSASAFAVNGANPVAPFDTNVSLPAQVSGNPSSLASFSTTSANTFVYGCYSTTGTASPTAGTGFTIIAGQNYFWDQYAIYSSAQTSVVFAAGSAGSTGCNGGFADALAASTTPTGVVGIPNLLPNTTQIGTVIGTPGTIPTNWSITKSSASSLGGLTMNVIGYGTDSSLGLQLPYIDLQFSGTTTGANPQFYFNAGNYATSAQGVSVSASTWYTASYYAMYTAGSPPAGSFTLNWDEWQSVGNVYQGITASNNTSATLLSTLTRTTLSQQTGASTNLAVPYYVIAVGIGIACNFTMRIAGIKFEKNATATTFIGTPTEYPFRHHTKGRGAMTRR